MSTSTHSVLHCACAVLQIFLAVIVNDMYSCKEWAIVPDLNFAPQFQSLAFRDDASGNAFARNVSIAFAHFVTQKEYGEMVSNQLKLGQTCDADDDLVCVSNPPHANTGTHARGDAHRRTREICSIKRKC